MCLVHTPAVCQETLNWFVKIKKNSLNDGLTTETVDWLITKSEKTKMTSSNYKNFISISLFTIQQISKEKKKLGWVVFLI